MPETVRLDEQFYIVAETERATTPLRVLKNGDSFAVFDTYGDITPEPSSEQGLYHSGTRFLSRLELLLGRRRPLLLNSTISEDNVVFTVNLTNPDILRDGASSCRAARSTSCAHVCCGTAATASECECRITHSIRLRCPSRLFSTPTMPTSSKRGARFGRGGVDACRIVAVTTTSWDISASMVSQRRTTLALESAAGPD